MESHLLQMRGLKRQVGTMLFHLRLSHLLQMRGLKRNAAGNGEWMNASHLLQMRGLKLRYRNSILPT